VTEETKPPRLTNEQLTQLLAGFLTGGWSDDKDRETVSRSKSRDLIQLTPAGAKQLLDALRQDIQFTGEFTKQDIDRFVQEYNKAANVQLDTVIKSAREKITKGASEGDARKVVSDLLTTTYPSFFNPRGFAEDFIWSKINFGDEKTLAGKALQALQQARGVTRGYGKYIISDVELQNAAKEIARGRKTVDQFIAELNVAAARDYPTLAPRLQSTPGATPRDLVTNYINLQAKLLEMDPDTIDIDDPYIQRAIRPDGIGGSQPPMSIPDFTRFLLSAPEREFTIAANEDARQGATALARAMGYGV
jgi:hypothetical protein